MKENIDIIVLRIKEIMKNSHKNNYIGEGISQLEHAILTAMEAEEDYPNDYELIIASFLHDIGHQLLNNEGIVEQLLIYNGEKLGVANYEILGKEYLCNANFPERVYELVNNHVIAKRYLCSKNIDNYYDKLSDASRKTFILQGGEMNKEELLKFESSKYFIDSLKVRKYDELGKNITKLENINIYNRLDYYINMISNIIKVK